MGDVYFDEIYSRLVSIESDNTAVNHVGQNDWSKMKRYFDETHVASSDRTQTNYNVKWGNKHYIMCVHQCSDGEEIYNPYFAVVDDNFSCS